jgi:hypothetical protein
MRKQIMLELGAAAVTAGAAQATEGGGEQHPSSVTFCCLAATLGATEGVY